MKNSNKITFTTVPGTRLVSPDEVLTYVHSYQDYYQISDLQGDYNFLFLTETGGEIWFNVDEMSDYIYNQEASVEPPLK